MPDPIPFRSKEDQAFDQLFAEPPELDQLEAWATEQYRRADIDGSSLGFHEDDVKFSMLQAVLAEMSPVALPSILEAILDNGQFDPAELTFIREAQQKIIDSDRQIYGTLEEFLNPPSKP